MKHVRTPLSGGERAPAAERNVSREPKVAASSANVDLSGRGERLRALTGVAQLHPFPAAPVQFVGAKERRAKQRAKDVRAEWVALLAEANLLQTRIGNVAAAFNYVPVVPAAFRAFWPIVPELETGLNDIGGDLYQTRVGVGAANITNFGNNPLGAQLTPEDAADHRASLQSFRDRLAGIGRRVDLMENQSQTWLLVAGNLLGQINGLLGVYTSIQNVTAAIGAASAQATAAGQPAANIRDSVADVDANRLPLAALFLKPVLNEGVLRARLVNLTSAYYQALGLNSGKMIALNANAGAVATSVVQSLMNGGKVGTDAIASVYRSEPFDNTADHFSIAWNLLFNNCTPKEKQALQWVSSWELHAHCTLVRGVGGGITGFIANPAATHVKPSLRQRAVGVSITVPAAFVGLVQAAHQAGFLSWLHDNARDVQVRLMNFALKV
ncbi:MAG: hypothetical protein WA840_16260 [Caulobacteraceae bacterium]